MRIDDPELNQTVSETVPRSRMDETLAALARWEERQKKDQKDHKEDPKDLEPQKPIDLPTAGVTVMDGPVRGRVICVFCRQQVNWSNPCKCREERSVGGQT